MRRSGNKLQVSTFPFLAVLLCAMGALILFLLVMDRRGKIVALAKGRAAREAQVADRSKENADRKAEWEKQRDAVHQSLLVQKQQLGADLTEADKLLAQARRKVQAKQAELEALQRAASSEGIKVAEYQTQIKQGSTGLADSTKLAAQAKAELERLSGEVADLEKVLADLKALKTSEQQTYSLVPYRGKHGDNRRPIYVECTKGGVVLHPERRVLAGLEFNAVALRGEVEKRAGGLEREAKKSKVPDPGPPRGPYVLFLVRPDGIAIYYEALSFLRGFEIDFGYEVIDQQWALDFSRSDDVAGAAPSGPGSPSPALKTTASGPGLLTPSLPNPGLPTPNLSTPNLAAPTLPSVEGSLGGNPLVPPSLSPPSPPALTPGLPNSPGLTGKPAWSGSPRAIPASKLPPAEPLVKAGPGLPFGGIAVDNGFPGTAQKPMGSAGPGGGIPSPWSIPGSGGTPVSPSGGQPAGLPSDPVASNNTSPLQGSAPAPPSSKPLPPVVRPVLGSRDFVITITCYSDRVIVSPGGKQFAFKDGNSAGVDQAVVQNVQDLIAGRQKFVLPGEPPYRPMIRFQLAAGGLVRFLHLYPRLEFLQVPMTRENLDD